MASLPNPRLTPQQYLETERAADHRSEYSQGQMFAMAGASREHILIITNIVGELRAQLRGRPCETYSTDMRVRVGEASLYTYPDVAVVCAQPEFADSHFDTLLNPTVLVEVLSPATEGYDRGEKFAQFRRLPSLLEYVLVAQHRPRTEHFARQDNGQWLLTAAEGLEAMLSLPAIDCRLPLSEIYDRVTALWNTDGQ